MRCSSCGTGTLPRRGACMYCGARLPMEEAAAEGPKPEAAPKKDPLAVLQEELSSIEFALQELDAALQEGWSALETRNMVRPRLLARRRELEAELIGHYASLPFSEAVRYLTDFLKVHPRNVQAHLERGRAYQNMSKYDEAVEDYLLAASLDPGHAGPHLRLAQLYEQLNRKADALYEYTTYMALESDPDPGRRRAVEARVKSLEQELVTERGEYQDQTIEETAQRLEYLLSTLKDVLTHPRLERRVLQQLIERYTRRLLALTAPPVPEPAVPSVSL